ncbi:MAG: glutamate--cysteine ligase [Pseudomonadota bacterium]
MSQIVQDAAPADVANHQPITDHRQLVAYLEAGCKPKADWRIGTEHEKFPYRLSDLTSPGYDGPDGIAALLHGMQRFGWRPVEEKGRTIALKHDEDSASISLEPAGQIELSGAPLRTIHETCDEVSEHLIQVKAVTEELGLGMIGIGFAPITRRKDVKWMPKGRYAIMRDYMATKGTMGVDMMTRSCTVQVNLDFSDEADMVKKARVSLALQPIATALFANSPFAEGQPSGFQSLRSQIWTNTDPDRTGMLPFVFEPGFGFERYVDYALDVPMYFVHRGDEYINCAGQSFRQFLQGKLPVLPGEVPTIEDWGDHLTTIFPEIRLKRFLEMRGADGGPWGRICALPALWVGLLYDDQALNDAATLVSDWSVEEMAALRRQVPRNALSTPFRDQTVQDIALAVLEIAKQGLNRRAANDAVGANEAGFLNNLIEIAESGRTPADEMLEKYNGPWNRKIEPVFAEYCY